MPKSLNEPVWLLPHCLTQSSGTPISFPKRSAQKRLLPPSNVDTTLASSTSGQTISRLPHTELPCGHSVRRKRRSNNSFQYVGECCRKRSRSCWTSSKLPHSGH